MDTVGAKTWWAIAVRCLTSCQIRRTQSPNARFASSCPGAFYSFWVVAVALKTSCHSRWILPRAYTTARGCFAENSGNSCRRMRRSATRDPTAHLNSGSAGGRDEPFRPATGSCAAPPDCIRVHMQVDGPCPLLRPFSRNIIRPCVGSSQVCRLLLFQCRQTAGKSARLSIEY
jgi:hypothetical protein